MGKILIFFIAAYQRTLSPETGVLPRAFGVNKKICVFYPSCSAYAITAIKKHGGTKGALLAARRILRCHPWQTPQVDMVD